MRFALSAIPAFVLSLSLATAGAVASESGEFIEWALEQGKACDSSWNSFVRSEPDGVVVTGAPVPGGRTCSSARTTSGIYTDGKGFIHKANLPFLPFSTHERNGPSRGLTKLESPASARLNVPHTRKRPFNSRTELGSFLRRRTGATRLSVTSSHRISRVSRTRRAASSSFTRTVRTR